MPTGILPFDEPPGAAIGPRPKECVACKLAKPSTEFKYGSRFCHDCRRAKDREAKSLTYRPVTPDQHAAKMDAGRARRLEKYREFAATITQTCIFCKQTKSGLEFPRLRKLLRVQVKCTQCQETRKQATRDGKAFCTKCLRVKGVKWFHKRKGGGPRDQCKKCYSKITRAYWDSLSTEQQRHIGWKCHLYAARRVTAEQYDEIIRRQNGKCAVCLEVLTMAPPRPAVDHCHASAELKIRGVLCHACNKGLGHFRDDPGRLERAAEYVRRAGDVDCWTVRLAHLGKKPRAKKARPEVTSA
jgi:hypothetical protein